MRPALLATLLLSSLVTGCVSHPADSPPPGYSLRTPTRTVDLVRWAVENDSPAHLYECLSADLIERESLSLSDVDFFFGEVKDRILGQVGSLDQVEVVDEERLEDGSRRVFLESGEHRATVRFVLDSGWSIDWRSARLPSQGSRVATLGEVMRIEEGVAVIALPIEGDRDPEDVYRVRLLAQWKIDRVESSNVETGEGAAAAESD